MRSLIQRPFARSHRDGTPFARPFANLGVLALLVGLVFTVTAVPTAYAGLGFGNRQAVGGVMIDPEGNVRAATEAEQKEMAEKVRAAINQPGGELGEATESRVISLARLQDALKEMHETGRELDDETAFLAGLQRVEYVVVDKENHDILLVGPAEPWEVRADGSVVGTKSGGSVLRLDDLVTAFRSVEEARRDGGILCSIEPTAEGRQRLQGFLKNIVLRPGQNPAFLEAGMRQAFGPQMIKLAGVPTQSRFARTLVAADFEMKRIAMALTPSPVKGLPSYLDIARNKRQSATQSPRWWMACNYDAIARDPAGQVWKISGQGVKTLTEEDIVAADGTVVSDGRQDPLAVKWANAMTEKYDSLSKEMPIFRDLRNAMDFAVVATLITQEQLDRSSGIDLGVLRGSDSLIELPSFDLPRSLSPQCSFIHGMAGWTVTASGGVNINAFGVVENQVERPELQSLVSVQQDNGSDRWWWNGN
ncbi:DUF1598 domain-containing protein [Allorhodopirellula heiligendammensis]|uniref:DUF1598 domain-containing protein n=1 Tax=Allorhodopirellula heiligendammensis TaxID=2714739 RepID=A0A5C6C572_9BACT|nr:DUF1598 domain-containing protein [Allorhodopirellula heiligendammensis]TWU19713.1 hypothetical protein Poly21_18880 [Allorhodopirellula heiligendammensis]